MPVLAAGVGGRDLRRVLAALPRARPRPARRSAASARRSLRCRSRRGALVGAAMAELYLKQWGTLAVTARSRPRSALVWLRWLIQLGLREEAAEQPIGPPIECPSCHEPDARRTPSAATAASRSTRSQGPRAPRGGGAVQARVGGGVKIAAFARARGGGDRDRGDRDRCSRGPARRRRRASRASRARRRRSSRSLRRTLVAGRLPVRDGAGRATSASGLRYGSEWHRGQERPTSALVLQGELRAGSTSSCSSLVEPSSRRRPRRCRAQVSDEPDGFLGVQRDSSAAHVILSPELGFVHGVGRDVLGDRRPAAEPGGEGRARVHGGAARRRSTVVVEAITNQRRRDESASSPFPAFQVVDELLETLRGVRAAPRARRARGRRSRGGSALARRCERPRPDGPRARSSRSRSACGSTSALLARDLAPGGAPLRERGGARPPLRAAARRRSAASCALSGRAASPSPSVYPQRTEIDRARARVAACLAVLRRPLPRLRRPRRPPVPRADRTPRPSRAPCVRT